LKYCLSVIVPRKFLADDRTKQFSRSRGKTMGIDNLIIVPFQPSTAPALEPMYRQIAGPTMALPFATALLELEAYLGHPVSFVRPEDRPIFGNRRMPFPKHRSLTVVTLATQLERAGLAWRAIDPGIADLDFWRRALTSARRHEPKSVTISTTFITAAPWLYALCAVARRALPESKLIVGGYYYATNVKQFLDLDADVLCVGEGEVRLPLIVRRLVDGARLDDIPGLYVRDERGQLRHTGHVEPLSFDRLAQPDWSLSSRIDPPVDLATDGIEFALETQRGCIFKCEFCTYRTLASPMALDPEASANAIMAVGGDNPGFVNLVDSTATYPHARWEQILRHLIDKGSRRPIWAYARVSDITPERAGLMARAGVRQVFIGQESADQTILNLMKKGTKASQVKPAIHALRAHGISATFSFMHGFPGETEATIQATRAMILGLNEPTWDDPTVFNYLVYPFVYMDFASVSRQPMLEGVDHYLGYSATPINAKRAVEEVLATIIATSRVPAAPVYTLARLLDAGPLTSGITMFCSEDRRAIFRWIKLVEQGTAIFLERNLEGRSAYEKELPAIREQILKHLSPRSRLARAGHICHARVSVALLRRLRTEWKREAVSGPGLLTRAGAAAAVGVQARSWVLASAAWKTGTIEARSHVKRGPQAMTRMKKNLAEDLVSHALLSARHRVLPGRSSRA
jgi:anaerobic magnesium-protoporphyrin IX monomethyl ester cyclase